MRKITYLDICPLWRCNAKCPTCDAWKRDPKLELSVFQAEQILKEPKFRHLKRLVIEGGEPTLWPHLRWFVAQICQQNKQIVVAIITNGLSVYKIEELAEGLEPIRTRLRWYVSLNGIGSTHDDSRGVPGAFGKTLNSAIALRQRGYMVFFSFAPFKQNIGDYRRVVRLAESYNISMSICFPTSRAKFSDNWELASKEDLNKLHADWLSRFNWRYKLAYGYLLYKAQNKEIMPCDAGKSMLHINPEGIIHACHMTNKYPLGGVSKNIDTIVWFKPDISGIPEECQYEDGEFCVDCYPFTTINKRKNIPKMLWSKICRK